MDHGWDASCSELGPGACSSTPRPHTHHAQGTTLQIVRLQSLLTTIDQSSGLEPLEDDVD